LPRISSLDRSALQSSSPPPRILAPGGAIRYLDHDTAFLYSPSDSRRSSRFPGPQPFPPPLLCLKHCRLFISPQATAASSGCERRGEFGWIFEAMRTNRNVCEDEPASWRLVNRNLARRKSFLKSKLYCRKSRIRAEKRLDFR
jgi:hypothetical protein